MCNADRALKAPDKAVITLLTYVKAVVFPVLFGKIIPFRVQVHHTLPDNSVSHNQIFATAVADNRRKIISLIFSHKYHIVPFPAAVRLMYRQKQCRFLFRNVIINKKIFIFPVGNSCKNGIFYNNFVISTAFSVGFW